MKYRIATYWTLTGKREFVDLGGQSYGEWIVYEKEIPKFHISCFSENSKSDFIIKELLEGYKWTIETIIDRINESHETALTLDNRPLIKIQTTSEFRDLELTPLPIKLIEKIKTAHNKNYKI
tara:strand:+ start:891 stop:1256 length:366 start_codon:yes stop_codon:yes gene_type:complete